MNGLQFVRVAGIFLVAIAFIFRNQIFPARLVRRAEHAMSVIKNYMPEITVDDSIKDAGSNLGIVIMSLVLLAIIVCALDEMLLDAALFRTLIGR